MRVYHLTFSTRGRAAGWPSDLARTRACRAIVRASGHRLILFCVVDDHVHVVLYCSPSERGRLARALLLALRPITACPLEPAHVREATNRRHQTWLVDYTLTQPEQHGVGTRGALWSGSCAADLLGARNLGWSGDLLADVLPRLRPGHVEERLGLGPAPLQPAPAADLQTCTPTQLADLVGAAAGLTDPLTAKRGPARQVRGVVASWGADLGWTATATAAALGVTACAVRRLAKREPDGVLVRASLLRLALERRVEARLRRGSEAAR